MSSGTPKTNRVRRPEALIESLHALCEEWLRPSIKLLREGSLVPREKVVNDGLWHSIHLHPWEVAIVDTKLVQRLREIRQLGVIHWVFPTAGHSRFEHSLGVVRQMQALVDGVERNSSRAGEPVIGEQLTNLLRIAALLHDAGHAIMSHVSDPIIRQLPQVETLIEWTHDSYKTWTRPSASEAIAAVFVTSPAFRELITEPAVGADFIKKPDQECRTIAKLIVGGCIEPGKEYVTLLLNGAFDADKLDYMPRDCMMAGVPCAIDVDRLIEKVQVVDVPRHLLEKTNYPEWLNRLDNFEEREHIRVLTVGGSGQVVREFAEMRRVLYEKVYQHQKVRAIELMAQRMFRDLRKRGKYGTVRSWLDLKDGDLTRIRHRTSKLFASRYLPKRAFGLESVKPTPEDPAAWQRLSDDIEAGVIQTEIAKVAWHCATALGSDCPGAIDALGLLEVEIDPVDRSRRGLSGFPFSGDTATDFRDHTYAGLHGEGRRDADAPSPTEIRIYAGEPAVIPVFFASRLVLERDYGQLRTYESQDGPKIDADELTRLDAKLAESGIYEKHRVSPSKPFASSRIMSHGKLLLEKFLKAAWPRIAERASRFGAYQSVLQDPISAASVAQFLRQFETERLARAALAFLESIELVTPKTFVGRLRYELTEARKVQPIAYVCPLGSTGDSSAFLSYLMNDLDEERAEVVQIEIALQSRRPGQIVLWDDFCGTGRHAICALSQWLGFKSPDGCKTLVNPLGERHRRQFDERRVTLCFGLAMQKGLENVRRTLDANGVHNVTVVSPPEPLRETDDYFRRNRKANDWSDRQALREFMREKAAQIFERNNAPLSSYEREIRLLGYNNAAHRVVFYYNVPNATVTCLWEGAEGYWQPLFRRRRKKSLPRIST